MRHSIWSSTDTFYEQHEKVQNRYRELKLWKDTIYINKHFRECSVEKRKNLLNRAKKITLEAESSKGTYSRLISS